MTGTHSVSISLEATTPYVVIRRCGKAHSLNDRADIVLTDYITQAVTAATSFKLPHFPQLCHGIGEKTFYGGPARLAASPVLCALVHFSLLSSSTLHTRSKSMSLYSEPITTKGFCSRAANMVLSCTQSTRQCAQLGPLQQDVA